MPRSLKYYFNNEDEDTFDPLTFEKNLINFLGMSPLQKDSNISNVFCHMYIEYSDKNFDCYCSSRITLSSDIHLFYSYLKNYVNKVLKEEKDNKNNKVVRINFVIQIRYTSSTRSIENDNFLLVYVWETTDHEKLIEEDWNTI